MFLLKNAGKSYAYMLKFVNSNGVSPISQEELTHHSNYFLGSNADEWKTDVRNFGVVAYRNLYDEIDLVYRPHHGQLKYEFIVNPGGDPRDIAMTFEGIESVSVDARGDAVIETPLGIIRDSKPISYQDAKGVACKFNPLGPISLGLSCDSWQRTERLVIDPLVYSTFIGGSVADEGAHGIAVDAQGYAYVTGYTNSDDFPTTPGAFDTSHGGGPGDVFVCKISPQGDSLVYSTFLGGDGDDWSYSIALDMMQNAYVTGRTYSFDFPTTAGSYDPSYNGGADAFITQLNALGNSPVYSTLIGSVGNDWGYEIVLDSAGNAFVAGRTDTSDFPTTPGAFDTSYNGGWDYFALKLNAPGASLIYSTLIGGSQDEAAGSIAIDDDGHAYLGGYTTSADFPTTSGAFSRTYGGNFDAFIAKLTQDGSALEYSTYLGGDNLEAIDMIAVDASGSAYVTSRTASMNFPTTAGAYDRVLGGEWDVFVTKLTPAGDGLAYSTYLGGSSRDYGNSINLDSAGNAYLSGWTTSSDFPVTSGAFDTTFNGGYTDSYVTVLDAQGANLLYSTYLGGGASDGGIEYSIGVATVLAGNGDVYLSGWTDSQDFPTTPGAYDTTFNGGGPDVYVTRLGPRSDVNHPPVISSFSASPTPSFEGDTITFDVNASDQDSDPLTYSYDFESDGVFDLVTPSCTTHHVYGDDFRGNATVRVDDGSLSADATAPVIALNLPPEIAGNITATATVNVTLRIAGERWHDVTLTVFDNGTPVGSVSIIRFPGNPDDQTTTIVNVTFNLLGGSLSTLIVYTPMDDPINGRIWGATPAWLILTSENGYEERLHHTFNVRHKETWTWIVNDLRRNLTWFPIDFTAGAIDPGSDDLIFTWIWNDGSPDTVSTYFNDGIGPDPHPSTGGIFPYSAEDHQQHSFSDLSAHSVTLRITDDDGGTSEYSLVLLK